jgi:acyl carrier protein
MNEKILDVLYEVIDDTNRERKGETPLAKEPGTALYGSASELDSLGLINFVVATEEKVESEFGKQIVLADDRALSQEPSPFSSVEALAAYIEVLLKELE